VILNHCPDNQRNQYGATLPLASTPAGDAADTSPIFWLGDVNGNIPAYYYVRLDIADQYWSSSHNDSIILMMSFIDCFARKS